MTAQDVAAGLKEIMAARLGLQPEQLVPEARLVEDLGLDSLDAVELAHRRDIHVCTFGHVRRDQLRELRVQRRLP